MTKKLTACFSSNNMNWCTPKRLFDELDKEFHFLLDLSDIRMASGFATYQDFRDAWYNNRIEIIVRDINDAEVDA